MEPVLVKEKMKVAVDETFFDIKKLVMEAMTDAIDKDREYLTANNLELIIGC